MSKLYNLLNTLIGEVNKSIKTKNQTLTEEQKTQARANINVASAETVTQLSSEVANKQPKGNYLTEIPSEYITEDELEGELVKVKAEMVQNTPLFAETVEDCTDTTMLYVVPNEENPEEGYIYAYGTQSKEVTTTTTTKAVVALLENTRYSLSGMGFKDADGYATLIVPCKSTGVTDIFLIEVTGMTHSDHWSSAYYGDTNNVFSAQGVWEDHESGKTYSSFRGIPAGEYYVTVTVMVSDLDSVSVTVNGKATDVDICTTDSITAAQSTTETTTEVIEQAGFYNTGILYGANVVVDDKLKDNSLNPVQNQVVKEEIDKVNAKIETLKDQSVDMASYISTVIAPKQLPADGSETADVNLTTCISDDIHALLDDVVARYPNYITRELMGKDASGLYDIYRYTVGKHAYSAWRKENYPKMYAWKNDSTIIYSTSVSPRIGDTLYSTAYIGTAYGTVTAVSAKNRSRTVNNLEFVRSENNDISATIIRTNGIVDGETMVSGDITYHRYPFGDVDKDYKKRIPMTIIANEHGGHEVRDCALIVTRLIKDLCEGKHTDNPVLNYIRENVNLTVIPVVNPHGWNKIGDTSGYYNYNKVNINRNYDTVGWDYCYENQDVDGNSMLGSYAGSENETQYVMNTMSESGAVIAMSVHGLSITTDNIYTYYQGQNPNGTYSEEKTSAMNEDYLSRYGLKFVAYNPLECPPETTSKSPSYITQIGAYGGIIEFNCNDAQMTEAEAEESGKQRRYTSWTMEQQYTLLLKFLAMWISDYEEQA